jgi:UbiD family decarboxylase
MAYRDLREFLATVERSGELRYIDKQVDPELEIGGIGRKLDDTRGPAVVFRNVKGYPHRVVMGIFGTTMNRIAMTMQCQEDQLLDVWLQRASTLSSPHSSMMRRVRRLYISATRFG